MVDDQQQNALEHAARRDDDITREAMSRAPVRSPEGLAATPVQAPTASPPPPADTDSNENNEQKRKERKPATFVGIPLPGRLSDLWHKAEDWGLRTRSRALHAAPAWIVNSSSNVIAGMHLVAELLMFKANGNNLMHEGRKDKLIYYIIDPPRSVWKSVIGDAHLPGKQDLGNIFRPSKWSHAFQELRDVKKATTEGLAALRPGEVLHNHWQARATLTGMTSWGLTFATPDYKDKEEDVERNIEMATKNPFGYGLMRLKQGVLYPFETVGKLVQKAFNPKHDYEIGKNKLQFTGLGVFTYGIWSTIGAWRNVGKLPVTNSRYYFFNPMYLATGLISIFAGIPPLFATNSEKGWVGFGTHMQLRSLFLPWSIAKQFNQRSPGALWYTGGHAIFQTHNAVASLIGGAKKLPDGTVIDHTEQREKAREQAIAEKKEYKEIKKADEAETKPKHIVSAAIAPERLQETPTTLQAEGV